MIVYLDKYLNTISNGQIYLRSNGLYNNWKHFRSLNDLEKYTVNILQFSLTLNNNRINDSLSVFWHDGICFE